MNANQSAPGQQSSGDSSSSRPDTLPPDMLPPDTFSNASNWQHTHSAIRLLQLAISQIETSIVESNISVQQLTDTFTQLANQTLRDPDPDQDQAEVWTSEEMRSRINETITAFQFYDRINQRLQHVSDGLERINTVFRDTNKINNPTSWQQIQDDTEKSYSMDCERLIFEKIMSGASVQEAVESYKNLQVEKDNQEPEDDIELF